MDEANVRRGDLGRRRCIRGARAVADAVGCPMTPADAGNWRPGDLVLGLYEVREVITSGGMGLVHRVRHRGWNVDLAVKSPRSSYVESASGLRSFETEAEVWVELGLHPNTVSCVYVRRIDGLPRVFAEWVDGGDLAGAIESRRLYLGGPRTALARILDTAVQAAWGLEHAHDNRLVHQDVKPANVLLTSDGTAKVTDFGLARARAAAMWAGSAADGRSLLAGYGGMTPAYCSPEQAAAAAGNHGAVLTRTTDVWSWALTVLAMFAGGAPTRHGQAGAEVFAAFREGAEVDPMIPAMPSAVADLLARCLAHDPVARPRRMGELADALVVLYADLLGEPYSRSRPEAAALRSDGMCNQALSLLDLGRAERAERLWDAALQADPHHVHSTYNRGLRRWRTGRITDDELVGALQALRVRPDDWTRDHLLALVHLERGDVSAARELLTSVARRAPRHPDIVAALAITERTAVPANPIELVGHRGRIESVALSADGRVAVTGGADRTVRVWELSGRSPRTASTHAYAISALAVSADGAVVVAGDRGGAVRVAVPGADTRVLTGTGSGVVDSVAVSPDGRIVLAGAADGSVHAWEAETGRRCPTPARNREAASAGRGAVGRIRSGARWTVVATDGRTAASWNRATGRLDTWEVAQRDRGKSNGPYSAVVSSTDGTAVLVETPEGTGLLRDLSSDQERAVPRGPAGWEPAVAVAGSRALTGEACRVLRLWDIGTGRCLYSWSADAVSVVAISPDGRLGLTAGSGAAAWVWDLPEPGPEAPWSYAAPRTTRQLEADRQLVADALDRARQLRESGQPADAAAHLRTARAVPGYERDGALLSAWRQVARGGRRSSLLAVWQSPQVPVGPGRATALDADRLLTVRADVDGVVVRVWDLAGRRLVHELTGQTGPVSTLVVAPTEDLVLSAGEDGTVCVWELATGDLLHRLPGGPGPQQQITLTGDGHIVSSSGQDTAVRVWDVATGRLAHVLDRRDDRVRAFAVNPDGRLVLIATERMGQRQGQTGVLLCDRDTGRAGVLDDGSRHPGHVSELAFSPDGRIAFVAAGGDLDVWDLAERRHRHLLTIYRGPLETSADSAVVLFGDDRHRVKVHDLRTGSCLHALEGHGAPLTALRIAADNRFAVSASEDATLRIWDLTTGRCLHTVDGLQRAQRWLDLSGDGHTVLTADGVDVLRWELDWDYEFPAGDDWDPTADRHLAEFLARNGTGWSDADLAQLHAILCRSGFGWLEVETVRAHLREAGRVARRGRWSRLLRPRRDHGSVQLDAAVERRRRAMDPGLRESLFGRKNSSGHRE
jgi:WD40 repeat protein/serine/threonine protein kinase